MRLVVASLVSARRSVADDRIDDLKLAVSEACTNAIEANLAAPVDDQRVVVQVWEAPERLEVCIADSGRGFDPDQLPEHPPVTDPDRLNFERGLGIPLIRSLVDAVRFESGPDGHVGVDDALRRAGRRRRRRDRRDPPGRALRRATERDRSRARSPGRPIRRVGEPGRRSGAGGRLQPGTGRAFDFRSAKKLGSRPVEIMDAALTKSERETLKAIWRLTSQPGAQLRRTGGPDRRPGRRRSSCRPAP